MNLINKQYKKSDPVLYRGCFLHSLLELKFVLSIEKDYRFLREPVKIGYNPKTLHTTNYFKECIKVYTPDFLIRNKNGGIGKLIEIKPAFLKGSYEMNTYKEVLTDYISKNKLGWSWTIVYSDEIILTQEKQEKFELLRKHKGKFVAALSFQKFDRKYNQSALLYSSSVPTHFGEGLSKSAYANFVKFGTSVEV
jgi:hypothetical protein